MDSSERLELSFLQRPQLKILTTLIAPDGQQTVQSTLEGVECPSEWVAALRAMAAATKDIHTASSSTSSPFSASLSREQATSQRRSRRSSSNNANRKVSNASKKASLSRPTDEHGARPSTEGPSRLSIEFSNPFDEARTNPMSRDPDPTSLLHTYNSSHSPTMTTTQQQQHPMTPVEPVEGLFAPSTVADEFGGCSSTIDGCSAASNPNATHARMQKLEAQLKAIKDGCLPDRDESNDTVRQLYQYSSALPRTVASMEHFGQILGRLGNISSSVGVIYNLLSWEVFRREENRLVEVEGQSLLAAARQVNEKMAQNFNRRCKTKDWASDGRKVARMVFDPLANLSTAARSFALIVLAGNTTRDKLLRIAHFPSLRECFCLGFSQIVESRQREWESIAANNYLVFDYEEFLLSHVNAEGSHEMQLSTMLNFPQNINDIGMADNDMYSTIFGELEAPNRLDSGVYSDNMNI